MALLPFYADKLCLCVEGGLSRRKGGWRMAERVALRAPAVTHGVKLVPLSSRSLPPCAFIIRTVLQVRPAEEEESVVLSQLLSASASPPVALVALFKEALDCRGIPTPQRLRALLVSLGVCWVREGCVGVFGRVRAWLQLWWGCG